MAKDRIKITRARAQAIADEMFAISDFKVTVEGRDTSNNWVLKAELGGIEVAQLTLPQHVARADGTYYMPVIKLTDLDGDLESAYESAVDYEHGDDLAD